MSRFLFTHKPRRFFYIIRNLAVPMTQYLDQTPPFVFRQGTGLLDPDLIANLRLIFFVMDFKFCGLSNHFAIKRVKGFAFNLDDYRFFHFIA